MDKAKPAMPVEIEGLKGLPMAGDDIVVVESEERARMLSEWRKKKFEKDRLQRISEGREEVPEEQSEEAPKRVELPIIVKADVQGTVQAVTDALKSLNSPQVCHKNANQRLLEFSFSFQLYQRTVAVLFLR